jgi:hypothetical protein
MHIELHLWRTGACYHVHIIHCTVSWLVQTSLYGLTSLTLNHSLGSYHQKHKTKCAPIGNSCMDLKLVVDQITSSSYKSLVAYRKMETIVMKIFTDHGWRFNNRL